MCKLHRRHLKIMQTTNAVLSSSPLITCGFSDTSVDVPIARLNRSRSLGGGPDLGGRLPGLRACSGASRFRLLELCHSHNEHPDRFIHHLGPATVSPRPAEVVEGLCEFLGNLHRCIPAPRRVSTPIEVDGPGFRRSSFSRRWCRCGRASSPKRPGVWQVCSCWPPPCSWRRNQQRRRR